MRLIDADELKKHKYHDSNRHEKAVAVAHIDWSPTVDAVPLSVIEDIKTEIRARVFDIQATSDKYFDGVDDVMDIVDSVIDKHISGKEQEL